MTSFTKLNTIYRDIFDRIGCLNAIDDAGSCSYTIKEDQLILHILKCVAILNNSQACSFVNSGKAGEKFLDARNKVLCRAITSLLSSDSLIDNQHDKFAKSSNKFVSEVFGAANSMVETSEVEAQAEANHGWLPLHWAICESANNSARNTGSLSLSSSAAKGGGGDALLDHHLSFDPKEVEMIYRYYPGALLQHHLPSPAPGKTPVELLTRNKGNSSRELLFLMTVVAKYGVDTAELRHIVGSGLRRAVMADDMNPITCLLAREPFPQFDDMLEYLLSLCRPTSGPSSASGSGSGVLDDSFVRDSIASVIKMTAAAPPSVKTIDPARAIYLIDRLRVVVGDVAPNCGKRRTTSFVHIAAKYAHADVLQHIVKLYPDGVTSVDDEGYNPLQIIAMRCDSLAPAAAEFLLALSSSSSSSNNISNGSSSNTSSSSNCNSSSSGSNSNSNTTTSNVVDADGTVSTAVAVAVTTTRTAAEDYHQYPQRSAATMIERPLASSSSAAASSSSYSTSTNSNPPAWELAVYHSTTAVAEVFLNAYSEKSSYSPDTENESYSEAGNTSYPEAEKASYSEAAVGESSEEHPFDVAFRRMGSDLAKKDYLERGRAISMLGFIMRRCPSQLLSLRTKTGVTPLEDALEHNFPSEVIDLMLECGPLAAGIQSTRGLYNSGTAGRLPIHSVAYEGSLELLLKLIQLYPEGVHKLCPRGLNWNDNATLLHLAAAGSRCSVLERNDNSKLERMSVLRYLCGNCSQQLRAFDIYGYTPLMLYLNNFKEHAYEQPAIDHPQGDFEVLRAILQGDPSVLYLAAPVNTRASREERAMHHLVRSFRYYLLREYRDITLDLFRTAMKALPPTESLAKVYRQLTKLERDKDAHGLDLSAFRRMVLYKQPQINLETFHELNYKARRGAMYLLFIAQLPEEPASIVADPNSISNGTNIRYNSSSTSTADDDRGQQQHSVSFMPSSLLSSSSAESSSMYLFPSSLIHKTPILSSASLSGEEKSSSSSVAVTAAVAVTAGGGGGARKRSGSFWFWHKKDDLVRIWRKLRSADEAVQFAVVSFL